jgi:hypothetical protein
MTPKQFVVRSDQFGLAAKSSAKYRVALASAGIAVVALVAWRLAVGGESSSRRALGITVLDVHDVASPARPTAAAAVPIAPAVAPAPATVERASPPAAEAAPRAAAASPPPVAAPPAPVKSSSASRTVVHTPSPRPSASRPVSATKSVSATKPVAEEPRPETAPTKPDAPPLETNPYVYK